MSERAIFDARADGTPVPIGRLLHLTRALARAYGDADVVVLCARTDEEWGRAVAASSALHRSTTVTLSVTGINPPTIVTNWEQSA